MKFKFLNPQLLFQCHHFVPPNKSQWFIDPKLQENDDHSCKYGPDQNIKVFGQIFWIVVQPLQVYVEPWNIDAHKIGMITVYTRV